MAQITIDAQTDDANPMVIAARVTGWLRANGMSSECASAARAFFEARSQQQVYALASALTNGNVRVVNQ